MEYIMLSVFKNEMFQLSVYGSYDKPLFVANDIGKILGLTNIRMSLKGMPTEYLVVNPNDGPGGIQQTNFVTESGLYHIVLRSNKPRALPFQKWVVESVLPSIRKTGEYSIAKPVPVRTTFAIQNEFDLHSKIVHFLKERYPLTIYTATLGENQDTDSKRIRSSIMGYQPGSPDLILHSLHKTYRGFAIEMKTPTGLGVLSDQQKKMIRNYELNGFKVLVSNSYDEILYELINYLRETRVQCSRGRRRFKTVHSLGQHTRGFHKVREF